MTGTTVRRVEYGERRITYELSRAETNRLRITVTPEGLVAVRAPWHASDEVVDGRVTQRGRWIVKQQDEITELRRLNRPKCYVSGETHRYLGRQYRLRVRIAEAPSVKLRGAYYEVRVPAPRDTALVQRHVVRWFRDQAGRVFPPLMDQWLGDASLASVERPRLTIRPMKKRWGSCSSNGRILLNPLLIHTPRRCIEYVIVHELCHLIHHHHGPEFYRLLDRVLPDWRALRLRLNGCEM